MLLHASELLAKHMDLAAAHRELADLHCASLNSQIASMFPVFLFIAI
jgi:hypothetical protein